MRGFAFPTEPGEWMLVVIGLQYVLRPLNHHIVDVNFADDFSAAWLAWTAIHVSPMLLPIFHSHDTRVRIYFGLQMAIELLSCAALILMPFEDSLYVAANYFRGLIPLALLAWIVRSDHVHDRQRGWLHWLGIAATAAPALIELRAIVAYYLAQPY